MYVAAGRRVRALKRGGFGSLGQANCPSTEQLMGITDCTDPCQASSSACAGAPGLPALPVTSTSAQSVISSILSSPLLTPGTSISTTSLSSALPWLLGGAVLIVLVGAMSGRH
jgi:hypothetical protein